MLETHVLGAIRVLKGVLPFFRAQKSGTIVSMSSFSGMVGIPGAGLYNICKFALEGLSETLQRELRSFDVRVIILEPGAFRTSILKKATDPDTASIGSHYLASAVGDTIKITRSMAESPEELIAGDPARLGQRVYEIVHATGAGRGLDHVLRFPFGTDSLHLIEAKINSLSKDFEQTRELALSANFEGETRLGGINL